MDSQRSFIPHLCRVDALRRLTSHLQIADIVSFRWRTAVAEAFEIPIFYLCNEPDCAHKCSGRVIEAIDSENATCFRQVEFAFS